MFLYFLIKVWALCLLWLELRGWVQREGDGHILVQGWGRCSLGPGPVPRTMVEEGWSHTDLSEDQIPYP